MSTHASLVITPHTTLEELFAHHPEAEELVIRLAPAFAKLRQPALRATVARVTELRQVAEASGKPLSEVMRAVHEAFGAHANVEGVGEGGADRPAWAAEARVTASLDARPILDSGGHPVQQVMAALDGLGPDGVFALVTPFVPGPLLEMARGRGFLCYTHQGDPALFTTFFARAGDRPAPSA